MNFLKPTVDSSMLNYQATYSNPWVANGLIFHFDLKNRYQSIIGLLKTDISIPSRVELG